MSDAKDRTDGALILIVDDNPTNLDVLARRLIRDGYRVEARESAVGLESEITLLRPDAVLLDWMMPERSGLEALIGLRRHWDANHLPVIMVTARDESQAVSDAIEAGATDYVTKPIDFTVLKSRLGGVLTRRGAVVQQDLHAAELERQVAHRTASLQQANERLAGEVRDRRAAEVHANQMARTDRLTGIPNRSHFLETLQQLAQATCEDGFFLIHVDIDRFRSLNSVHGPETGDAVLIEVARRLSRLESKVELVARTAADEFSILGSNFDDHGDARSLATTIHSWLKQPMNVNGRKIVLDTSIAVSMSGPTPCSESSLLLENDAAMRTAQRTGGDSIAVFDDALGRQIREAVAVKTELAAGIPRGEIVPYYQPIVSLQSGKVECVEVLARWKHPVKGLVEPAVFIPAAEETGLVDDLFWEMLPQVCEAVLRCKEPIHLAMNLSPAQVLDRWFPQKLIAELTKVGFPPKRFEIELTEAALFADLQATKTALTSLRNQGVGVSLDDFGVGFSSLSLLRELPITKVKVDRSYIAEILADDSAAQMVRSLASLCKSMKMQVTAEGIEDEATARKLNEWGCELGQGFWFARPAAELSVATPWMDAGSRNAA